MEGWNPIYSDISYEIPHSIWINHYPRAPEVNAAVLSTVTDNIEKCKAINLFLIITTFFIAISTIILISDNVELKTVLIIGFLISMNPVSIYQSLSFCVDGQLASTISCLICLMLLLSKKTDIFILTTLLSTISILMNIKFLGVVYVLIFSLGLVYWFFIYHKEKMSMVIKFLLLSFIIGIVIIGYNPYITNTFNHGNPFYPVVGAGIDIIGPNKPVSFQNIYPFEELLRSIFSHPSLNASATPEYQIPFIFSCRDLEPFSGPDPITGGFGPVFSGAIILSLLNTFSIFRSKKRIYKILKSPDASLELLTLLLILISVLINSESWWARYAPQLWLLPILLLLLNIKDKSLNYKEGFKNTQSTKSEGLLRFSISYFLILVLLVNISVISGQYAFSQYTGTKILDRQLNYLSSLDENVTVDFHRCNSNRFRLIERGIEYTEIQKLNCSPSLQLWRSGTRIYILNQTSQIHKV